MGWFSCVDVRALESANLYIPYLPYRPFIFFCFDDDDQNDVMTGTNTPIGHFLDWERSGAGGPFWVFFFLWD